MQRFVEGAFIRSRFSGRETATVRPNPRTQ